MAIEKGVMSELKTGIISYLRSQQGILSALIRQYPLLGMRIATWITGEKPILMIGGEPGNGKSLLMGELVLRYNELTIHHNAISRPLLQISYDKIHYLFLKRLSLLSTCYSHKFLPEGETHPDARALITDIIWYTLLFSLQCYARNTPVIIEAPLIDHRGEDLIHEVASLDFQMQIFIMHSPSMRMRSLYDEKRQAAVSAHPLAMQKIHNVLLQQRGIVAYSEEAQNDALARSWEQWLGCCEGMLLSWSPDDNEDGFMYTKSLLETLHIRTDPLSPILLEKYALCAIEFVLKTLPNIEAFARNVQEYGRTV
jgi:hypothetical protein